MAVIDHQAPLQDAVDAPRYHHQWLPDTLQAEPGALTPRVTKALEAMGHTVVPLDVWAAGNSAAVIRVAPADPRAAAHALGFPHPGALAGRQLIAAPRPAPPPRLERPGRFRVGRLRTQTKGANAMTDLVLRTDAGASPC